MPRDRRQLILSELLQKRHVAVRDLAAQLGISEATVRRDLRVLDDEGEVTLVHGGATLPRTQDYSLQSKRQRQTQAKAVIGALAAGQIRDGDQVYLDSGSTCFEVAAHLRKRQGVCVLANSTRLAMELDAPNLEVILLGGKYRPDRMDTVGPITLETLDQMRGYLALIGADGLSMDFGPSATDVESAHLHRLVVEHARETILLADHTKFESPSLFRIVAWDRISRVITDQPPTELWQRFFASHGIDLQFPDSATSSASTTRTPASPVSNHPHTPSH